MNEWLNEWMNEWIKRSKRKHMNKYWRVNWINNKIVNLLINKWLSASELIRKWLTDEIVWNDGKPSPGPGWEVVIKKKHFIKLSVDLFLFESFLFCTSVHHSRNPATSYSFVIFVVVSYEYSDGCIQISHVYRQKKYG